MEISSDIHIGSKEMVVAMRFASYLAEETLVLLLPNILDIDIFMALASTRSVHR